MGGAPLPAPRVWTSDLAIQCWKILCSPLWPAINQDIGCRTPQGPALRQENRQIMGGVDGKSLPEIVGS